jgi:hypothetical protein
MDAKLNVFLLHNLHSIRGSHPHHRTTAVHLDEATGTPSLQGGPQADEAIQEVINAA